MTGRLSKLPSKAANAADVTSSFIASDDAKERAIKQYIFAGLAAMVLAGGLISAAPPASAGCLDPGWAAHPLAQMCDSPVNSDGMWERCLTYHNGGPYTPAQTDCYIMSAGQPPPVTPSWERHQRISTRSRHTVESVLEGVAGAKFYCPTNWGAPRWSLPRPGRPSTHPSNH